AAITQLPGHGSPGFPLLFDPSSQLSPASRMPLPQPGNVQLESHVSPLSRFPSSHCSPGSRLLSPQWLRSIVVVVVPGAVGVVVVGAPVVPGAVVVVVTVTTGAAQ